ncbi:HNH endonuclease [Clostridium perfringens]|uniref:HNH endonuclease n=2 Tax=Clostridium perfringens TaxID=1502 RepID=UPI000DF0F087|nr:HNH endonuclease [Clostridium perfringens]MDK0615909.1 HNH endonuclease [Clostridium perfringens]NGT01487.1 HNH endonuclease [Clostridium perfringens]STB67903.1 HNH endonuclease [Clostridium perfringens]
MKKEHIFKNRIEYKECSACKKLLELNNFSKNKSSWDGLKPYCKKCASEKGKIYRRLNHEDDLNRKKEWYLNTKNRKEDRTNHELKLGYKICSKCNIKKEIKDFRERANGGFYSVCRTCENKYNKLYRIENPEVYKANHVITEQRRRKRAKEVTSSFTNSDWEKCKEYFNNECAYCGKKLKNLTQDHVIPLSKGGNYTKDNIIPVCRNCNSQKHNKDFNTWYKSQKFYSEKRENKIKKYLSIFK